MFFLKENKLGIQSKKTELEISETKENYKFSFKAYESMLLCPYFKDNENLSSGEVCEVYIGSSDDLNNYYEIEVSPFDNYFFAKIYNPRTETFCINFKVDLQENNGFFTKKVSRTDKDYFVDICINKKALNIERDKVVFNAFRVERNVINIPQAPHDIYALNPTFCHSFHKPEYFVKIKDYIK